MTAPGKDAAPFGALGRRHLLGHGSRNAEDAERIRRDAAHVLRNDTCVVCAERDISADRWIAYFVSESHTDGDTQNRVQSAVGFCPAHTRRLLADDSAPWLMPQVHQMTLVGGQRLLREHDIPAVACPACDNGAGAAERALAVLGRGYGEETVRRAVEGGAVCLPHLVGLMPHLTAGPADALAAAVRAALAQIRPLPTDVPWLAGTDPDVGARTVPAREVDTLFAEEEQARTATERWNADTGKSCCPLCLAGHRAVARLLRWEADPPPDGGPGAGEATLCATHLHDSVVREGPGTPAVLAACRDRWAARFERFRTVLGGGDRKGLTAACDYLLHSAPRCRACAELAVAEGRQADLLRAELSDPRVARAYEQVHGLCLHHGLTWHHGPLPEPARAVLGARLALLGWEVEEALRKQSWSTRHEIRTGETEVGRRAPTLLDGRVHSGQPHWERVEFTRGSATAPEVTRTRRTSWNST